MDDDKLEGKHFLTKAGLDHILGTVQSFVLIICAEVTGSNLSYSSHQGCYLHSTCAYFCPPVKSTS